MLSDRRRQRLCAAADNVVKPVTRKAETPIGASTEAAWFGNLI
jgi:hypothetical protein